MSPARAPTEGPGGRCAQDEGERGLPSAWPLALTPGATLAPPRGAGSVHGTVRGSTHRLGSLFVRDVYSFSTGAA